MAALVYIVILLALTGHSSAIYCVCKDGVGDSALQKALDYACGAGADCSPILQNGACYQPNTIKDHCSYAVNSYFQRKGQTAQSCDFSGAASQSQTAPSTASSTCVYPASTSQAGTGSTTTNSTTGTTPSTGTTPTTGTGTGTGITTPGTPASVFGISPVGSSTGIGNTDGAATLGGANQFFFSLASALCFTVLLLT
ncbi:hypothetical protein C1H46_027225 [Malus baccata]|uniref:X8 domain-containing protein n=1 Tax=Malus baccata TaxID=106549 RepID=A0A540LL53_MALBA|nr:hypothetical protein C1H46_027225 [Malus baccata]